MQKKGDKMEKELESDSEKLDVPQFLFIGGTAG